MLGAEIWAVSPDPADKLSSFAGKQRIGFRLLSDPELQVISSWGLINPKSPKVPHPAAVIVDPDGVIRYLKRSERSQVGGDSAWRQLRETGWVRSSVVTVVHRSPSIKAASRCSYPQKYAPS